MQCHTERRFAEMLRACGPKTCPVRNSALKDTRFPNLLARVVVTVLSTASFRARHSQAGSPWDEATTGPAWGRVAQTIRVGSGCQHDRTRRLEAAAESGPRKRPGAERFPCGAHCRRAGKRAMPAETVWTRPIQTLHMAGWPAVSPTLSPTTRRQDIGGSPNTVEQVGSAGSTASSS